MGSVLYLDRGMRRRGNTATAQRVQAASSAPSILRPGYNCWTVARAERVAILVDAADYFKAFTEAALRQLAGLGILNPSEDQIRTALVGGTLTTVNGVYQLPGLLPR